MRACDRLLIVARMDAASRAHTARLTDITTKAGFQSPSANALARDHADRLLGVASLCTPYTRRTEVDLAETMRRTRGPQNYMVTFQAPGVGEALLGRDIGQMFHRLMRRPALDLEAFQRESPHAKTLPAEAFLGLPELMGEPFLSEADIAAYVQAFTATGRPCSAGTWLSIRIP